MNYIQKIAEDIEGLPDSTDPYAPARRPDVGDIDKDVATDPEPEMPEEGTLDEPEQEPLEDEVDMPGDEQIEDTLESGMPFWEPIEVPNKKDLAFKRSDGFTLRARELSSVPGKWVAQLYTGDKILDKGTLFIPSDVEPTEYLQKMSDYMLDKESNRYNQKTQTFDTVPSEPPEMEVEPVAGSEEDLEVGEEPLDAGSEEDLGLDDENFEIEDVLE